MYPVPLDPKAAAHAHACVGAMFEAMGACIGPGPPGKEPMGRLDIIGPGALPPHGPMVAGGVGPAGGMNFWGAGMDCMGIEAPMASAGTAIDAPVTGR
mmetsp:Transcript_20106/g.55382  ORF Transcript_20106/g.55382 Transcript_20106/m.55382 type:complete len:98 (-) Transcript_20106:711-1004(-)